MRRAFSIVLALALSGCVAGERELSIEERAAKLLIVGVEGQQLNDENPIVKDIAKLGVAGVILFEKNIAPSDSRRELSRFVEDMKRLRREPLFVAIDQEGGAVNRLKPKYGFEEMPSQRMVASARMSGFCKEVASTIAREVASVGINVNFAPCVDLDINPECPAIGAYGRSFSPYAGRVVELASVYVEEHRKEGVLTSLKHFPGHGSSTIDSHLGLTDITDTWQSEELTPFCEMIASGACDMVMVSHLFNRTIDPLYPASLSHTTIDSLLRREMKWDGVVVSDDMQMRAITDHYGFEESIVLALNAGVDLFVISRNGRDEGLVQRFINAVKEGVLTQKVDIDRLNEAVKRVDELLQKVD